MIVELNLLNSQILGIYAVGTDVTARDGNLILDLPLTLVSDDKSLGTVFTGNLDDLKIACQKLVRSQIDDMGDALTGSFTETEQKGWTNLLPQARLFLETSKTDDAPLLALDASIRDVDISDRATAVIAAAEITELLPSIASGIRGRVEQMISAAKDVGMLLTALGLLKERSAAIVATAQALDKEALLVAATDWPS